MLRADAFCFIKSLQKHFELSKISFIYFFNHLDECCNCSAISVHTEYNPPCCRRQQGGLLSLQAASSSQGRWEQQKNKPRGCSGTYPQHSSSAARRAEQHRCRAGTGLSELHHRQGSQQFAPRSPARAVLHRSEVLFGSSLTCQDCRNAQMHS